MGEEVDLSIAKVAEVLNLEKWMNKNIPKEIVSLDIDKNSSKLLIGTTGCQIYEFDRKSKTVELINQSHFGEELWGLCSGANEHHQNKFVTCGDDKTVRMWDITKKEAIIIS